MNTFAFFATLLAMAVAEPLYVGRTLPYAAQSYKTVASLSHPGAVAYANGPAPLVGVRQAIIAQPAPIVKAAPVVAAPIVKAAPITAPIAAPVIAKAAPIVAAPVVKAAPVAQAIATQYHKQDEFGNYEYGYANPNSQKKESGNAYTGVQGSYSYVDGYGIPQTVNYVADGLGFRASGTNFPATAATLGLNRYRRSVAYAAPAVGIQAAVAPAAYAGYATAPVATAAYAPAAPVAYAAGPTAVVPSAPAQREALLTKIKLNPGHAEMYRVFEY